MNRKIEALEKGSAETFGLGILEAESEEDARRFGEGDPSVKATHRSRRPIGQGETEQVRDLSKAGFRCTRQAILKEVTMIARIWHGYTKPEHADAYESMLKPELLPGISNVQGYKGSYLLRRRAGNEIEFITIMLWDSIEAIRAVAGADYETAVVPAERRKYLAHYDPKSSHYEVVSTHQLQVG
jgi:heme-degrading monooxygenase HmoA